MSREVSDCTSIMNLPMDCCWLRDPRSYHGLLQAAIALAPYRRLRRKMIRVIAEREFWWREGLSFYKRTFLPTCWKYNALRRLRGCVETLVLGSSHAYYGYAAEGREFNLGDVSLDLHYSYELLNYWMARGLPALRRVVVFYDVFSPGSIIEKSSDSYRLLPYYDLYGFPELPHRMDTGMSRDYPWVRQMLYRRYRSVCPGRADGTYRGNMGYGLTRSDISDSLLSSRVKQHAKLSHGDQVRWIREMAHLLEARQIPLYVLIAPVRGDYRSECIKAGTAERACLNPLPRNALVVDPAALDLFEDGMFSDMDHLNEAGASKLTTMMRGLFEREEGGHEAV